VVFQKEKLDNKMTVEDCFEMLDVAEKWGCYIDLSNRSVSSNKTFTNMLDCEKQLTVSEWLCFFSKKDQSILKVRLEHPINQEDFYVRLQVSQQYQWVKTSLKIVQEGVFIIGDVPVSNHDFSGHNIEDPLHLKEVNQNQNVDHFMTWLSLIDQEMVPKTPSRGVEEGIKQFQGNQHFRQIMEKIPHGFSVLGEDWKIEYMNPTLENIVGRSFKDLNQKSLWAIYPTDAYQDMFAKFQEAYEMQEVLKHEQYVEDIGKTLEFTIFPNGGELTLFIQDLTEVQMYTKALQETEERFSLLAENVNEAFWITTTDFQTWEYMSPSFEKIFQMDINEISHNKERWLNNVHDDHRDEVKSAYLFMRHQKVAVEYRFRMPNGDWKWEIRNPLTSIKGFMQLMMSNQMDVQKYSEIIFSELSRIETIVNEFMLLAKPREETELVETNVHDIISYALSLFENQIHKQNIDVLRKCDSSLPVCLSDPKRLKQIFINLVKNALEAMEDGGRLFIQSEYLAEDASLCFTVTDTGKGIEQDKLQRIGEPFFTTKEKGTGLGVMVTNKFVESLGGTIKYESELGQGTSVIVTLPFERS